MVAYRRTPKRSQGKVKVLIRRKRKVKSKKQIRGRMLIKRKWSKLEYTNTDYNEEKVLGPVLSLGGLYFTKWWYTRTEHIFCSCEAFNCLTINKEIKRSKS